MGGGVQEGGRGWIVSLYIGIDPGKSGGIGFVPDVGEPWAEKMPDTERDLLDLIRDATRYLASFAMIEQVAASPQMGTVSAFSFGRSYGMLRMALIAAEVPFETVASGVWQKSMRCLTGGNKNVSKARAQELFPTIKMTHAIADALLIAEFCRRMRNQARGQRRI
jgi:hypothetical protein